MEPKEWYFNFEYFLTFLLFLPSLNLFPPELFSFRKYFLVGIITGAGITYMSRDKLYSLRKFVALLFSTLVILWMIYLVSKSTLLYRDVMVICIEGISVLAVVFSFSACFQEYLNYIQLFSILLFLCICALTGAFSKPLLFSSVGFIFCLLLTARVKFHRLFSPSDKSNNMPNVINAPFIIILFLAVITAWMLFVKLPLGKIKTWGVLTAEDLSGEEKAELNDKNKKELSQDSQIQGELTKLILNLTSTDEMYQALALVGDLLAKEEASVFDVGKAEHGLLDMLDKPALALEEDKKKEMAGMIKEYVDDKILKNLSQIRNKTEKVIENNRIVLLQRMAILSSINKIGYSDSLSGIRESGKKFENVVNGMSISDSAKKELKDLGSQMKGWKLYQLYRKESDSFQKETGALDENKKQDSGDLAQQINNMKTITESCSLDTSIENLSGAPLPELGKLKESAKKLLNLKREMLAAKQGNELLKKLENSGLSQRELRDLKNSLDAIEESNNPQKTAEAISSFLDSMREENGSQMPEEAKDILGAKLNSLVKKTMEAAQKQIRESGLGDSGKDLSEALKKIESEGKKEKITSDAAKIQRSLEALFKQGKITKEARDNLMEEIEGAKKLLVIKSELKDMGRSEKSLDKTAQLDYGERLSDLLQSSSLGDEQKELMSKLTDKLAAAQTVSQVEDALEKIGKEVESSAQKWNKEDAEKIKELMQQAAEAKKMFILEKNSYDLRRKIEALKSALPQQATLFEKNLDKLRESKTDKDLSKNVSALEESLENRHPEEESNSAINKEILESGDESLDIYLLPNYIVLPLGSLSSLKSVAIYNSQFVKEIAPELEWFSSNSSVAFVDNSGLVKAVGMGKANITARYKGVLSKKCEVTVVNMISDSEVADIKSELDKKLN